MRCPIIIEDMVMKYGFCTGFASIPLWEIKEDMVRSIRESGYDYPEFPVMTFSQLSEEEFSRLEEISSAPVACNLFPSNIPLSDNNRNLEDIKAYLDVAFSRSRRLSIEKIIFGSGKARRYSSPTTIEEAWKNLYSTIEEAIIPKAKEYGITVLIEPLTRGECNLINTLMDGYRVVKDFNDDSLLLMADLFHMKNNGEDLSTLETCLPYIRHIHIAGKERKMDETICDPFLKEGLELLKSHSYNSTISFETLDGDKKRALEWLKAII